MKKVTIKYNKYIIENFNFVKHNELIEFKIKIINKSIINIFNKEKTLKILIDKTKNIIKINKNTAIFDKTFLEKGNLAKNLSMLRLSRLISFGTIQPLMANETSNLEIPNLSNIEKYTEYKSINDDCFSLKIKKDNITLGIFDESKKNDKLKTEESRILYNNVQKIKQQVISDLKNYVLTLIKNDLSQKEINDIKNKLDNFYNKTVVQLSVDNFDEGVPDFYGEAQLDNVINLHFDGLNLTQIQDINTNKMIYNFMLHESTHLLKIALTDKEEFFKEDIAISLQQILGQEITSSNLIHSIEKTEVESYGKYINLLENIKNNNNFFNEKEYKILEQSFDNLKKIEVKDTLKQTDYTQIYGKRNNFAHNEYFEYFKIPKEKSMKNNYVKNFIISSIKNNNIEVKQDNNFNYKDTSSRIIMIIKDINNNKDITNKEKKDLIFKSIQFVSGEKNINNIISNLIYYDSTLKEILITEQQQLLTMNF